MDWMNAVDNIVQRYGGQGGGAAAPADAHQDFQQVAQAAPPEVVAGGLSQAFRSEQTPPFPEMVSSLFAHSDADQRAGLLNRILASVGPGVLGFIPGLAGMAGGGSVTPEQASQVTPGQVQQMAEHAQRENPSIIDEVSGFYAQHPQAVKAIGVLAVGLALQHMMKRQ